MGRPKEKIPCEIKNAREWDPERRNEDFSSSDDDPEFEYDDDDDWAEDVYSTSSEQIALDTPPEPTAVSSNGNSTTRLRDRTAEFNDDDDGFQMVEYRSKKRTPKKPPHTTKSQHVARSQLPHPRLTPRSHAPPHASQSSHPQHATSPRRLPLHVKPIKCHGTWSFSKDNLAKAAFRKRLPANGHFTLHKDAHEVEPDRKKMYDLFEEMGVRLNSFIRPPQTAHDRGLEIWGNARDVVRTEMALKEWLNHMEEGTVTRPRAKEKFSKENSAIGSHYKTEMRRIEKEAILKKFQQVPEPGKHFQFTGTYLWPMEEINPHDIFGVSMEAFDIVRFKNRCHIVFEDRSETFRIFSDRKDAIENSISQIEGALKAFVAQNCRKVVEHCVHAIASSSASMRTEVRLNPGSTSKEGVIISKLPVSSGEPLKLAARTERVMEIQGLRTANVRRVTQALRDVITVLPFYQGSLRIRIHFGTFELRTFKCPGGKDNLAFEEFLKNIRLPGTKGNLLRK